MAQRRHRLSEADRTRVMELYKSLPIRTDAFLSAELAWRIQSLAQEYGLTGYDATYLELAQRKGLGLATTDQGLQEAARKAGLVTSGAL